MGVHERHVAGLCVEPRRHDCENDVRSARRALSVRRRFDIVGKARGPVGAAMACKETHLGGELPAPMFRARPIS